MTCAEFQNVLPSIIDSDPSSSARSSLAPTSDSEEENLIWIPAGT